MSYSREDRPLVERLVHRLEKLGHRAVLDWQIRPGTRFPERIQRAIRHSHLFLALLTAASVKQPWVHQETGYAIAMGIPTIPLAVGGVLPKEMLQEIEALRVKQDLSDLDRAIKTADLDELVREAGRVGKGAMEVADLAEERALLISRYAAECRATVGHGKIRHSAALSSFCIPTDWNRNVWELYDGKNRRTEFHHKLLRSERIELGRHAQHAGCDLVISPNTPPSFSPAVSKARLKNLREFLATANPKLRVVFRGNEANENLIIVGDWFLAESRTPRFREGYRHTMFCFHAPSIRERIERFDQEFDEMLAQYGGTESSFKSVIKRIDVLIRKASRGH